MEQKNLDYIQECLNGLADIKNSHFCIDNTGRIIFVTCFTNSKKHGVRIGYFDQQKQKECAIKLNNAFNEVMEEYKQEIIEDLNRNAKELKNEQ